MASAITVLRRTTLYLATPGTPVPVNPIAQLLDTSGWRCGLLQVRVYGISITPSPSGSAAVRFMVYNTAVSEEDPAVTLTEPRPLTFVQVDSGGTSPTLLISKFAPKLGRQVSVMMSTHLISTATSVTGNVTVGIELLHTEA
jgi:hypothetical protein